MSQKQTKKNRKEIRRRVDENFGVGLQALHNIVRHRPRLIPKLIWILAYAPLFKIKHLRTVYKTLQ